MNNQKGFTLIEMIVVIVILGILSAVAVPKFVDMQDEAKEAALEGARGAVKSASALVHSKWLVAGEVTSTGAVGSGYVAVEGAYVAVTNGYPAQSDAGIVAATDIGSDFDLDATSGTITREGEFSSTAGDQYWGFTYVAATTSASPQISTVSEITAP